MLSFFGDISNYLIGQSLQIAVLFAVVGCLCLLLRPVSSHVRYLLWLVVIAKCIFPSVMKVSVAVLPEKETAVVAAEPMLETQEYAINTTVGISKQFSDYEPVAMEIYEPGIIDRIGQLSMLQWAGIIWLVGVILYFAIVCFRTSRLNRQLCSLRRPVAPELCTEECKGIKVWEIDGIGQPFVWGLFRGSVYLPGDFDKNGSLEDRQGILMHEFAHVRRFDAGLNLLQIFAQGLFWFHPLVWIANTMVRREREKCCDEAAIAKLKSLPRDYGNAIIDTLAREYEPGIRVPSLAVAGPVKNIENRLKTIMRPGKKFYTGCGVFTLVTIILLATVTVPTGLVLTAKAEDKKILDEQKSLSLMETPAKLKVSGGFHQEIRNKIDLFLQSVAEGDKEKAAGFMGRQGLNDFGELRQMIKQHNVQIAAVYADSSSGLLITTPIQADHGRVGPLVFTVNKRSGKWLIDDIDVENAEGTKEELNRFLKEHKDAALGSTRLLKFHGLDLSRAASTIDFLQIDGLYERKPDGKYRLCKDVRTFQYSNPDGKAYYTPKKNIFYISPALEPVSSVFVFYGPFKGDPRKVLKGKTVDGTKSELPRETVDMISKTYKVPVLRTVRPGSAKDSKAVSKEALRLAKAIEDHIKNEIFTSAEGSKNKGSVSISNVNVEMDTKTAGKNAAQTISQSWAFNITVIHIPEVHKKVEAYLERFSREFETRNRIKEEPYSNIESDKKKDKCLLFYGLDLSKAASTIDFLQIDGLYERKPDDPEGYRLCKDVHTFKYSNPEGKVYYLPKKNIFYIFPAIDYVSSVHVVYGPFKGHPSIALKNTPKASDSLPASRPVGDGRGGMGGLKFESVKTKEEHNSLTFYGLDLFEASVTTKPSELDAIYEERPANSKSYQIRKEVLHFSKGYASVYYVPSKDIFYVQNDPPGSSTFHYYGPFKGDPRKVLKDVRFVKPCDKQITIETRFIVVNENFLEDIGLKFDGADIESDSKNFHIEKIKKTILEPKVSYDFFVGSKPMENKKAAEILRHMGVTDSDDVGVGYIDDKTVDFLIRFSNAHSHSRTLTAPKITLCEGEPGRISVTKENQYVSGYKEVTKANSKSFEPVTKSFNTGIDLTVTPKIIKQSGNIDLAFESMMKDDISISQHKHKSGKIYDVVELLETGVKARLEIPEGKTLLIVGPKMLSEKDKKQSDSRTIKRFPPRKADVPVPEVILILFKPAIVEPAEPVETAIRAVPE